MITAHCLGVPGQISSGALNEGPDVADSEAGPCPSTRLCVSSPERRGVHLV